MINTRLAPQSTAKISITYSTGTQGRRPVTTPSAAPGWYPDPSGAPGQRYFDGTRWTEQRSDVPAPATTAPAAAKSRRFKRPDMPKRLWRLLLVTLLFDG